MNEKLESTKYRKNWDVLINPAFEESLEREPLLAFSFVLSTRNNQLATVADEILGYLDSGMSREFIHYGEVAKAGILVWLWTLGAYEIIRTMHQAKTCFTPSYGDRLQPLKKKLAKVRMPEAKMEKPGKRVPVNSDRSPWCELIESKDLLIGDPDDPCSARELIAEYFSVIDALLPGDVITRHEDSYR